MAGENSGYFDNDWRWLDSKTGERFGEWLGAGLDKVSDLVVCILSGVLIAIVFGIECDEIDNYEEY